MSVHSGHRQRVKGRYCREGLESFEQHQVLELMLFYCIPQRDTNEIAHKLIQRFGSLPKVLRASAKELEQVEGVGKNVSCFLSLFSAVEGYCKIQESKELVILEDIEQCGKYLARFFHNKKNETVYLLCLDAKRMVLDCRKVCEGSVNSASISIRKVVDMALSANATSAVLAHNHPSGMALPSGEDIETTKRVARALHLVDVTLSDHIVVAEDEYVSLAQSRLYSPDMVCEVGMRR